MKRNIQKAIATAKAKMNERLNITMDDVQELRSCGSTCDAIIDSFYFGYTQGMKATDATKKKQGGYKDERIEQINRMMRDLSKSDLEEIYSMVMLLFTK